MSSGDVYEDIDAIWLDKATRKHTKLLQSLHIYMTADWQLWEPAAARFCPVNPSNEYFTPGVVPLISAQLVDCPPSAASRLGQQNVTIHSLVIDLPGLLKGGSWSQCTSRDFSGWKDILVISKEHLKSLWNQKLGWQNTVQLYNICITC